MISNAKGNSIKPAIIILLILICCTCHIRPILATQFSAAIVATASSIKDNHCGKTFMVEKGSRKIDVVQGVSNLLFRQEFCTTLSKE